MAADIGLVGLAVMGQNLVLNMADHGYTVSVFNRTSATTDEFLHNHPHKNVSGYHTLDEFVSSLSSPRKIMLMVKAGEPVDQFISLLQPLLDDEDIIIDGGNSNYQDTIRRSKTLHAAKLRFLGVGVSGGEEGARTGPSIMPGGDSSAWPEVKPIFQDIAAKVEDGSPCCEWVGSDGAGHYVKMVHNGIEYGDMQLIVEAYRVMRELLRMPIDEIAQTFARWNQGKLDSYLIEITAIILKVKDSDGQPLIDKIVDAAGQKGTGKWTAISALEQGIPITLIGEAVFQRFLSSFKLLRVTMSKRFTRPSPPEFPTDEKTALIDHLEQALYAAKIISYSQGFMLMQQAAETYGWNLDFGNIALMWRGGCIIRSIFLGKIRDAYAKRNDLSNLLLDEFFEGEIQAATPSWRTIVSACVQAGIAVPGLSAALSFFDGITSAVVPANLIQAQRDFFGAHGYYRLDAPDEWVHTEWSRRAKEADK